MSAKTGGLVYGTILVATLLSAESARRETYPRTVGAVAIALVLYWLTVAYSQFTGERMQRGERFELKAFWRTAYHDLTLIYGATGPLLLLVVFWLAGAALTTAVSSAIWFAAGLIVATEVVIGVRADLTGRQLVVQTAFGAVLGLLVIALRVLLH